MSKPILASVACLGLAFSISYTTAEQVSSAASGSRVDNSPTQNETIERLKVQVSVAEIRLEAANKIRRDNSETIAELHDTISDMTRRLAVSQKMISMLSKEQLMQILDESQKQMSELQAKEEEAIRIRGVYDHFRDEMKAGKLVRKTASKDESKSW